MLIIYSQIAARKIKAGDSHFQDETSMTTKVND